MIKLLGICVCNLRWRIEATYLSEGLFLDIIVVVIIRALGDKLLREARYAVVAAQAGGRRAANLGLYKTGAWRAISKRIRVWISIMRGNRGRGTGVSHERWRKRRRRPGSFFEQITTTQGDAVVRCDSPITLRPEHSIYSFPMPPPVVLYRSVFSPPVVTFLLSIQLSKLALLYQD